MSISKKNMIDFHSHILPSIDDGSRNIEESLAIIKQMYESGIETIIATPHFYCTEQSADSFIAKRNEAYKKLMEVYPEQYPNILLGGEVLYNESLVNSDCLTSLCVEGTGYLLLEMPYTKLTDRIIDGVRAISNRGDIKVIIAHIERYLNFTSMSDLLKLMNSDVLGQINAKSLMSFSTRRQCVKLAKSGYVQLIGSDYHRIDRGDVTIDNGIEVLNKKVDKDFGKMLYANSRAILDDKSIDYVLS